MDSLTIAVASGMRARMEALDMLANNIANANTTAFKADMEHYDLYAAAEAYDSEFPAQVSPVVKENWTDFSQGSLAATEKPLDMALKGEGFFLVRNGNEFLLTRNGSFRTSQEGFLETQDGHAVEKLGGGSIKLDPTRPVTVDESGSIIQDGREVAKLDLVRVNGSAGLAKRGATYFSLSDPQQLDRRTRPAVLQGKLETSNVATAETAVRLVNVMRQFEMLQRAATLGGEMTRKAVEDVARVNG